MMRDFQLPPTGFGPGSQISEEGEDLAYMELPSDMRTYAPHIPDVEADQAFAPALNLLRSVADTAAFVAEGARADDAFDLGRLDTANRRLIAETLGEGEVAMKLRGVPALSVQESVFAGVWSVTGAGIDRIEVGQVPMAARERAFDASIAPKPSQPGPGVVNAPALLAELTDKSRTYSGEIHTVNLTLLPHTEEDLAWLDENLGQGSTDILSRGYGNCRIRATSLPYVWRVQFFNSMDTLILDTFEVTDMPEVALAATEDLLDSSKRLVEVLEAIR